LEWAATSKLGCVTLPEIKQINEDIAAIAVTLAQESKDNSALSKVPHFL